jgi:hypothetical protein
MSVDIVKKLEMLPPDLQKEVVDYVDFLLAKRVTKKKKTPKMDWMGGLKEYRDWYTALELQKKAAEWRN